VQLDEQALELEHARVALTDRDERLTRARTAFAQRDEEIETLRGAVEERDEALAAAHAALDEARRDRSDDDDDRWSGWSGELDPEPPEGAGTSGDGETQAVVAWPADARPARTRSRWLQPDLLLGAALIFIVLALGALLFFQVVWVVITG
jgi:hypothetical protein